MFTSKTKLVEERNKAQVDFASLIKMWHEEYQTKQTKLEVDFDINLVEKWSVNIWD